MLVAVTGANGFVGRAVVPRLLKSGHRVRALVRYPDSALVKFPIETIATGAIESLQDWRPYLQDVDAVIHLAARAHLPDEAMDNNHIIRAINTTATLRLAESALKKRVKHFIYLSSAKVYGDFSDDGQVFTESDPYHPQDVYAQSKVDAEKALRDLKSDEMAITVLRAPLIYGLGVRGNFKLLTNLVRQLPLLPFGALTRKRSLLYVGNLADALSTLLTHVPHGMNIFNLSDGEDVSTTELVKLLQKGSSYQKWQVPFPEKALSYLGKIVGKQQQVELLTQAFSISSNAFQDKFSWVPPFTIEEGVKATVQS